MTAQTLLQNSILSGLGVDPTQVQSQYNQLLVVKRDTGTTQSSWWDILGNVRGFTVEVLISGVLWLVGQFASLLLFWAYVIQKFILFSGYALSPLLIGFMAIRPLRHIGSRYLLHMAGVLLWPLGWAVAALITQGILDFMTDPSFKYVDPTATLYTLQASVGVAAVAFWIIFSTVAAPLVIQKVIAHRPTGRQRTDFRGVQQLLPSETRHANENNKERDSHRIAFFIVRPPKLL